ELRLKTYNFPGWSAHIDGEKAALSSDKDGAQVIQVPPGVHHIQADFVDTPPRRLGSLVSALGLLIMASVTALDYKRRASWRFHRRSGQVPAKASSAESQGIKTAGWSAPGRKLIVIGVAIVVLLVAVVFAWWLRSSNQSSGRRGSTRDASSSESKSRPPVYIGSEVTVHLEGAASVPMGVDERALDELMVALSNRSSDQVEALVQSGRVIQVDNDTRVRLVEMGSAKLKVRILEGTRITSEAWVPERWVR
ncbi:MAG TPA: hypothetical protein VNS63_25575, partial [Blastocatellia bacterium]|nr:hypothetical protein [Blastocatellia bacterium]